MYTRKREARLGGGQFRDTDREAFHWEKDERKGKDCTMCDMQSNCWPNSIYKGGGGVCGTNQTSNNSIIFGRYLHTLLSRIIMAVAVFLISSPICVFITFVSLDPP